MKNFITNKQISFMLYCIIIGYGIINLPKNAAEAGGTGGWFVIFIVTIIFMLITYVITYLQYKYEGKTIYEYSGQLVGKFITYIFMIIYIVYWFSWFTFLIRIYSETITLTILIKTPSMYVSILFYAVTCYVMMKGINIIARLCLIYGVLNLIFSIFFSLILFTQGNVVNLMPVFVPGDIGIYIKSISKMITAFLGMEILTVIPINKSSNKNLFKYTITMIGFIGILYIYIVESAISVVGVGAIVHIKASIFNIAKGVDVTYLEFLRRLDGIYIFAWTLNIVCEASLWGYGTSTVISKVFKNIKYNFIVIFVVISSFIIGRIPKSVEQVENIFKYISYGGIIPCFVIPSILAIMTRVKKYDKNI